MAKVGVFLANGVEEIEALTVVDLLRRADVDVSCISVTGQREVTSSHRVTILADELIEDVDFDALQMLILPGGMPGTLHLEAHELLMKKVDEFNEKGKYLSAICAAPSIFGHKGFLKGRKACCFPEFESHLEGAEIKKDPVCVSDHIITSRGMGTAIDFGLAIVARMVSEECANSLSKKIVYR